MYWNGGKIQSNFQGVKVMDLSTLADVSDIEATRELSMESQKRSRFLIDESIEWEVTNLLREMGWNAKRCSEVGLNVHSTEEILTFAYKESRILLTREGQFLNERKYPHYYYPGVVVLPPPVQGDRAFLRALSICLYLVGDYPENYRGKKVTIAPDGTVSLLGGEFYLS